MLTGESVSRLAGTILRNEGTIEQVKLLKLDWRAFLEQEFRLSSAQTLNLSKIPENVVKEIQDALNQAAEQGGTLQLRLASEVPALEVGTEPRGELTITPGMDLSLKIEPKTVFHCHFAADCGNWDCYTGPHIGNR